MLEKSQKDLVAMLKSKEILKLVLHILLVEDLTTDGNSKIKFCEALREAGAKVDHTFVVFYYDIFPQTKQASRQNWVGNAFSSNLVGCIKSRKRI